MDVKEVESLRDNISWLKDRMPNYLSNWQATRPVCEYNTGLIKEICDKPGTLISGVFNPLIKWLFDYELNRDGKIAFAGASEVDKFLTSGLYRIYRFVVVSDFFSNNPQYFSPSPSPEDFAAYTKSKKAQKEFSEFLDILNSKLIGCNENLSFLFLKLSKTIKKLPLELQRVQQYLENYCNSLRIKELRK